MNSHRQHVTIRWEPSWQYRGFLHPDIDLLTVLASHYEEEARSLFVNNQLFFTVALDGTVVDFELSLGSQSQRGLSSFPTTYSDTSIATRLPVLVAAQDSVSWCLHGRTLFIAIGDAPRGDLPKRLGETGIQLLIDGNSVLRGIQVEAIEVDRDGSRESEWITTHYPPEKA